jgi:hypothetical protein
MNITNEQLRNIIQEELEAVLKETALPKDRESLIKAGMQIGGYLNCKLFVQELYGVAKIKELPSSEYSFERLKVGDIIAWYNGMHYAVYLGNGEILQVEEWGSSPEVVDLEEANEEHDDPMTIYTPPSGEIEEAEKKKPCKPSKGKRFAKRVNGKCRSYGQKGQAKGGGDRIRPGTKKGDAYCARSAKIKKCKNPPCANDLSRKKWKCRGSKSMK